VSEHSRDLIKLDVLDDVLLLRAAVARWMHEAAQAERQVERLTERIGELERQLEARRSDEVEEIQQGRLLAAAEARRIERSSRPLVSGWTTLLVVYSAALALLALLVGLGVLYA
jgi:predicted RNase H-like nuclease (RuvC/YqgF family)